MNIPQELPIAEALQADYYPLSQGQKFRFIRNDHSPVTIILIINGIFDYDRMQIAIDALIERHPMLRTRYLWLDNEAVQQIIPNPRPKIRQFDARDVLAENEESYIQNLVESLSTPFDLSNGLLLRPYIIEFSPTRHVVFLLSDHITLDAWSKELLIRDLLLIYQKNGSVSELPKITHRYVDFATWQYHWLQGDILQAHLDYWSQHLGGSIPPMKLAFARREESLNLDLSQSQRSYSLEIALDTSQAIARFCQKEKISSFMFLCTILKCLLYYHNHNPNVNISTPIANRDWQCIQEISGYFNNSIIINTQLDGRLDFRSVLRLVRSNILTCFEYRQLPMSMLIEALNPSIFEQALSEHVTLSVQPHALQIPNIVEGWEISNIALHSGNSGRTFKLYVFPGLRGHLTIDFRYELNYFREEAITMLIKHFERFLTLSLQRPEENLLSLLKRSEDTIRI